MTVSEFSALKQQTDALISQCNAIDHASLSEEGRVAILNSVNKVGTVVFNLLSKSSNEMYFMRVDYHNKYPDSSSKIEDSLPGLTHEDFILHPSVYIGSHDSCLLSAVAA